MNTDIGIDYHVIESNACLLCIVYQVERGWTVNEVRQWAQRTALLGSSGFLVLAGFQTMPGDSTDSSQ